MPTAGSEGVPREDGSKTRQHTIHCRTIAGMKRTLAAACAESGRFVEAEETARRAFRAAELLDNRTLVNALRDEIALYELGLPYHTSSN